MHFIQISLLLPYCPSSVLGSHQGNNRTFSSQVFLELLLAVTISDFPCFLWPLWELFEYWSDILWKAPIGIFSKFFFSLDYIGVFRRIPEKCLSHLIILRVHRIKYRSWIAVKYCSDLKEWEFAICSNMDVELIIQVE